jgi:hypothetical protein
MLRVKWLDWWLRLLLSGDGIERDNRVLDEIEQAVQTIIDTSEYSPTIPLASSLSTDKA